MCNQFQLNSTFSNKSSGNKFIKWKMFYHMKLSSKLHKNVTKSQRKISNKKVIYDIKVNKPYKSKN